MSHPGLDWSIRAVRLFPRPSARGSRSVLLLDFIRAGTPREGDPERVPFGDRRGRSDSSTFGFPQNFGNAMLNCLEKLEVEWIHKKGTAKFQMQSQVGVYKADIPGKHGISQCKEAGLGL